VDGHEIAGLPNGFPFPDDAKVSLVMAGATVHLTAPGVAELSSFYRRELPAAGFTVDFDTGGNSPDLTFSNDTWQGIVSMNSTAGAVINWGVRQATDDSTSEGPAGQTEQDPLTWKDLGLTNADFFMRFPAGTKLSNVTDAAGGTNVTFDAPDPATVLEFYRELATGSVHFTRDSDNVINGAGTLVWHTDDNNMVLTLDGEKVTLTSSPR